VSREYNEETKIMRKRIYTVNENFFEKIDNSIKSNVLGFIFADGYNAEYKNQLVINLWDIDKYYLEGIKFLMQSEHPITFRKRQKQHHHDSFCIGICSAKICKDLKKMGCYQNKSLTVKFPSNEFVPTNYQRDFVRGYFEGDGSVSLNKSTNSYNFTISSTQNMCEGIANVIKNELGIKIYIRERKWKHSPNINYEIGIGGNKKIYKILNWLYKDAPFVMFRKYKIYLELKEKYSGQNLEESLEEKSIST